MIPTFPYDNLSSPTWRYSVGNRNSVQRTQNAGDMGFTKQISAYTSEFRDIELSFRFTETEFYVWQTWIDFELYDGNSWFMLELPLDGVKKQYRVRIVEGRYSANFLAEVWTVNCSVEVELNFPDAPES